MEIKIVGKGVDFEYVTIQKELFDEILSNGITEDDLEDLRDDADTESGRINGQSSLYIDGVVIKTLTVDSKKTVARSIIQKGEYSLIRVEFDEGENSLEFDGEFDEKIFEIVVDKVSLPDGDEFEIISGYYNDDEIEFSGSIPQSVEYLLFDKEGQVYNFDIID